MSLITLMRVEIIPETLPTHLGDKVLHITMEFDNRKVIHSETLLPPDDTISWLDRYMEIGRESIRRMLKEGESHDPA